MLSCLTPPLQPTCTLPQFCFLFPSLIFFFFFLIEKSFYFLIAWCPQWLPCLHWWQMLSPSLLLLLGATSSSSHPSLSFHQGIAKRLVKEQRKAGTAPQPQRVSIYFAVHTSLWSSLFCFWFSPSPDHAPSLKVSRLNLRNRDRKHWDGLVFLKIIPFLNYLGHHCLSLVLCCSICSDLCPLWAALLSPSFPSSMHSRKQIAKLSVQTVVWKELSRTVAFADISLFLWLLGTKLKKEVEQHLNQLCMVIQEPPTLLRNWR